MLMVYLPLIITRWVYFACMYVLFGASVFWLCQGRERWSAGPGGLPGSLRATMTLVRIAACVAAVSGAAWLAFVLINMTRYFGSIVDPEDLRLYFFETPFGTVSMLRLALLAIGVAIAFLPRRGRSQFVALGAVSALLLVTQAWFGHSADGKGLYRAMAISAYGIHMLATAAWVGGLPPLLFALVEQRRFGPLDARAGTLDVCSRFSLMAMIAVTFVVTSGVMNAALRAGGSFVGLLDSDYGHVLLEKLAIVGAMLTVAYFNRFIAVPRLRTNSSKRMTQIIWLRNSVAFDIVLGSLVLGASAVLGITMPPQ